MIVDTNFRHPRVETIFVFNDTSETSMIVAKEELINAQGIPGEIQDARETIRYMYGDEYVSQYDCEDSPSYGRKNTGREGTNRGADNSGIDEQQQERTETLTDRRVLEIAASELDTSDLTEGEIFALNTFKKRLENIRDLQAQRKEQGSLYKEQQFGSKSDRSEAVKTLNRMNILDGQLRNNLPLGSPLLWVNPNVRKDKRYDKFPVEISEFEKDGAFREVGKDEPVDFFKKKVGRDDVDSRAEVSSVNFDSESRMKARPRCDGVNSVAIFQKAIVKLFVQLLVLRKCRFCVRDSVNHQLCADFLVFHIITSFLTGTATLKKLK